MKRRSDCELVAYLARTPELAEGEAKHIWPKGLTKHLEVYGAWQLKEQAPARIAYLVESPFAVMTLWQTGFPAVSPFGFSLSTAQIDIVNSLATGILWLPDRDKRKEAAQYAGLLAERVWVKTPGIRNGGS